MGRIEKTVFISYRCVNASWALAIFQNLTQNGYDVFFDFTVLQPASSFAQETAREHQAAAHNAREVQDT